MNRTFSTQLPRFSLPKQSSFSRTSCNRSRKGLVIVLISQDQNEQYWLPILSFQQLGMILRKYYGEVCGETSALRVCFSVEPTCELPKHFHEIISGQTKRNTVSFSFASPEEDNKQAIIHKLHNSNLPLSY